MKPPLFRYVAPRTLDEAIQLLSDVQGSMVLAGGQSLVPAMNMRLVSPAALVDIQHVHGLKEIRVANGRISIGAMVRHRKLELDDDVAGANPLVRDVMAHVAHVPIRNRGTVVGSLCHGDAAAELPLLFVLCGGSVVCAGRNGQREIPAQDFFQFHLTTSRRPDEIAVQAHLPMLPHETGYAFEEYARRHGDYAVAAIGCLLRHGRDGRIEDVRLAATGVASKPTRLEAAEAALKDKRLTPDAIAEACAAARAAVTAEDDMHATRPYRQRLVATLVRRTIETASRRALGEGARA